MLENSTSSSVQPDPALPHQLFRQVSRLLPPHLFQMGSSPGPALANYGRHCCFSCLYLLGKAAPKTKALCFSCVVTISGFPFPAQAFLMNPRSRYLSSYVCLIKGSDYEKKLDLPSARALHSPSLASFSQLLANTVNLT